MRTSVVAAVCLSLSFPALAQDVGDYAADVAPGNPLATNPGVYAATANRLADFYTGIFDPKKARTVFAETLLQKIDAGEKLYLLDIRPDADYAKGHIPGAVSIPLDRLFLPENLAVLPTDGTAIIVICHTGHTASMALGGLAAMGYNPYVLRFSMMAWFATSSQKIYSPNQVQTVQGLGGPLEQ